MKKMNNLINNNIHPTFGMRNISNKKKNNMFTAI